MCQRTYVCYSCNHTGRYLGHSGCNCAGLVGYHRVGRRCAGCIRAGGGKENGGAVGKGEEKVAEGDGDCDDRDHNGDGDDEEEEDDWDFSGDMDDDDDEVAGDEDEADEVDEKYKELGKEEKEEETRDEYNDSDSTNSAITVLRSGKPITSRAKILTQSKPAVPKNPN